MGATVIAIEGGIGAGKTTLVRNLAELGYHVAEEDVHAFQNELEEFYRRPCRATALALQLKVLTTIEKTIEEELKSLGAGEILVVERSPQSSLAFASNLARRGLLEDVDMETLRRRCSRWDSVIRRHVYVDTPVSTAALRVRERNRRGEEELTDVYLTEVIDSHALEFGIAPRPEGAAIARISERVWSVDGGGSREKVLESVLSVFRQIPGEGDTMVETREAYQ